MKLLGVIPALNEAERIGDLVTRTRPHCAAVLAVDDGSSDDTAARARAAGAEVHVHEENRGKGAAIRTAFDYAEMNGFDAVVILDGDGQHDPDTIPAFLEAQREHGYDIVIGTRMGDTAAMPWHRRATNRFMSWLISKLAKAKITDTQSGYRLIAARVWRTICLTTSRYDTESEILIRACAEGFKVGEVPITTIYNDAESGISKRVDTLRFFRLLYRLLREKIRRRRKRILSVMAVLMLAGVLAFGAGYYETFQIERTYVEIPIRELPEEFDGYRIALISCLHTAGYGTRERRLRAILEETQADILLMAGDFRSAGYDTDEALASAEEIFRDLVFQDGMVAVRGNHDKFSSIPKIRKIGFEVLENESLHLRRRGATLTIIGLEDENRNSVPGRETGACEIVVVHNPDALRAGVGRSVPLILAGHTHGGQVCLPWIGPILTETDEVGRAFASGLARENDTTIYVNRGIGWTGLPVRTFCRPEVTVITLRRATP